MLELNLLIIAGRVIWSAVTPSLAEEIQLVEGQPAEVWVSQNCDPVPLPKSAYFAYVEILENSAPYADGSYPIMIVFKMPERDCLYSNDRPISHPCKKSGEWLYLNPLKVDPRPVYPPDTPSKNCFNKFKISKQPKALPLRIMPQTSASQKAAPGKTKQGVSTISRRAVIPKSRVDLPERIIPFAGAPAALDHTAVRLRSSRYDKDYSQEYDEHGFRPGSILRKIWDRHFGGSGPWKEEQNRWTWLQKLLRPIASLGEKLIVAVFGPLPPIVEKMWGYLETIFYSPQASPWKKLSSASETGIRTAKRKEFDRDKLAGWVQKYCYQAVPKGYEPIDLSWSGPAEKTSRGSTRDGVMVVSRPKKAVNHRSSIPDDRPVRHPCADQHGEPIRLTASQWGQLIILLRRQENAHPHFQ